MWISHPIRTNRQAEPTYPSNVRRLRTPPHIASGIVPWSPLAALSLPLPATSARFHADKPVCPPCLLPAAPSSNPNPFFPPTRTPPPVAAMPDNSRAPTDECVLQNCGSRSTPPPQPYYFL